jgi:hypothetical protein
MIRNASPALSSHSDAWSSLPNCAAPRDSELALECKPPYVNLPFDDQTRSEDLVCFVGCDTRQKTKLFVIFLLYKPSINSCLNLLLLYSMTFVLQFNACQVNAKQMDGNFRPIACHCPSSNGQLLKT